MRKLSIISYRNLLFSILILICFISTSYGQIDLKIHAGLCFTDLNTDPQDLIAAGRAGTITGLGLSIGNKFYGEFGANYYLIHYKLGEFVGSSSLGVMIKTKVHTVRVPVNLGYRLIKAKRENIFNMRLYTGPVGSFVVGVGFDAPIEWFSKDDFSPYILGWNFGMGIDLWLFFIEGSYELGITDMFINDPNHAKNNALTGTLGMRIKL